MESTEISQENNSVSTQSAHQDVMSPRTNNNGISQAIVWNATTQSDYSNAIIGNLASPDSGQPVTVSVTLTNTISCALVVNSLDQAANETYLCYLAAFLYPGQASPDDTFINTTLNLNGYYVVRTLLTGSFVAVFQVTSQTVTEYVIVPESLIVPNCLGGIPTPTTLQVIPPDSPRVAVGVGVVGGTSYIIREQMWKRDPNSASLAGGENVTISYTMTSGKTETSSSESEVSKQVSASASAGWGPISASVSASLSESSRSSHEVSIMEQTEQYHSNQITNSGSLSVMYIRWQMMDILVIAPRDSNNVGWPNESQAVRVEIGQQPIITSGPWDINALPDPATLLVTTSLSTLDTQYLTQVAERRRKKDVRRHR